jgi:2-hydroxycyclohexanecarboxyl-CoA dehydrogenase
MRLNLGAVLHVTHAYVGAMVDGGWGRIVTIVSDAGRRGERFQAIYGAAKAGAMGFVRGLASEVGAHGVTANCVSLGTMKTGVIQDAFVTHPELEAKLSRPYTVPRLGRPEDPALLVALLCSEAGAWITGQVYPVDGGYASAL